MLHGVGAVVSFRSQQGIGLLEGRVVTGRLFVCCPGFPLPAFEFQSWVFCWTAGIVVGLYRRGLYASNALLALLSNCSGRRFLTSQPYSPLGWGHSLVVSSFALFTVSDFFWGGIFLE